MSEKCFGENWNLVRELTSLKWVDLRFAQNINRRCTIRLK